jgi:hypothetical protein
MNALELLEATTLPPEVAAEVATIADEACECAYAHIHQRLRSLGYPCTGDVMPCEHVALTNAFQGMVRSVALNNPGIATMQGRWGRVR